VAWCAACEWNLDPSAVPVPPPTTGTERIRRRLQTRYGQRIFDDQLAGRAAPGAPVLLWLLVAPPVLLAAVLLAVPVVMVSVAGINPVSVVLAGAIGAVTYGMVAAAVRRPRPPGVRLGRHDAVALWGWIEEVAARVGAPVPTQVWVTGECNASVERVWGGTRLRLGYPLWLLLTPAQRTSVLGHELGHLVNGDPTRGVLVGPTIRLLSEFADGVGGGRIETGTGYGQGTRFIVQPLLWVARRAVLAYATVLAEQAFRRSQVAEYAADALGARAGGHRAAVESHGRLDAAPRLYERLDAVLADGTPDVWAEIERFVASIPDDEWERRLRVARHTLDLSGDTSHPATGRRIAVLEALDGGTAMLAAPDHGRIDGELAGHGTRLTEVLRDRRAAHPNARG
jgi:Zn-dependent protease with chaperone function